MLHIISLLRIYYSQITLQPAMPKEYIDKSSEGRAFPQSMLHASSWLLNEIFLNRAKEGLYRYIKTNQYDTITADCNFNPFISSRIDHPTRIVLVPYHLYLPKASIAFKFGVSNSVQV